jgi:voltage-gated potassium channel
VTPRRQLALVGVSLLLVVAAGTAGYMVIEGWDLSDALFMTVITLTTVGYNEVHPLSSTGRVFTVFLIIGGVGAMLYGLTTMVQYVVENQLTNLISFRSRRVKAKISKLREHIILCGYGQMGRETAKTLRDEGIQFVVIDYNQQAIARAIEDNCPYYIQGNATEEDVLVEAGVRHARALVAAVGSDADNTFITLSAKGLLPELLVVSRASAEESEAKLRRAGASRVVLPLRLGGRRLGMLALHPLVVDFIETTLHGRDRDLVLEDIKIVPGSSIAGMTVAQVQKQGQGIAILAVKKKEGTLLASPPGDTDLQVGEELVMIGTREQLRALEGKLYSPK